MEQLKINLKSNINDVLNTWPETIPVFLKNKMNCVGCDMNLFETIHNALVIYDISPKQFLIELNAVIDKQKSSQEIEDIL